MGFPKELPLELVQKLKDNGCVHVEIGAPILLYTEKITKEEFAKRFATSLQHSGEAFAEGIKEEINALRNEAQAQEGR